jgi:type VI secretion system protein ImpF
MDERKINIRRPLFDRLVDDEPRVGHEPRPLRTLDGLGLIESVRRELELLFNTRSPSPAHQLAAGERTVIDYGIPDFGSYSAANADHRRELAGIMREAAMLFEPRLHDLRVRLVPDVPEPGRVVRGGPEPQREASLGAQLEAVILIDGVPQHLSFGVVLALREGKVHVHAGS